MKRARPFLLVVLVVALWPLGHRGLVEVLDADPWKLGGFAMYTSYQTSLVAIFEPVPGGLRIVDERTLDPRVRLALQRFRARRSALGNRVHPDGLAAVLYEAEPARSNIVVVVQRMWLDSATSRIDSEKSTFMYVEGEPVR